MAERIVVIEEGKRYYRGGTVPKTAGHGGVRDVPMMAAEYVPEKPTIVGKRVYRGGTTTSLQTTSLDENEDDMGRQLIT